MSYFKRTITNYSKEYEFIQGFITSLTMSDRRITCLTDDLEEQYATTGVAPHFTLDVDGAVQLIFTRRLNVPEPDFCYTVRDDKGRINTNLFFSTNISASGTNAVRTFKYRLISNDSVIRLEFDNYNGDLSAPAVRLMTICCGDDHYSSATITSADPFFSNFVSLDNSVVRKTDRLSYTYDAEAPANIEMIKSKVFVVANSTIRSFSAEGLFDVSYVPQYNLLSIGGKDYYALDSHTVMEV